MSGFFFTRTIFGDVQRIYLQAMRNLGILLFGLIVLLSCRKEQVFEHKAVNLQFSQDTIFLDTVFSTIGSSTRTLVVKNPTSENISIGNIRLGKGQASFYRLNINGTNTKNLSNVEIFANDSIYIFIEVTPDVGTSNELLYTDSIVFSTKGKVQDVDLVTLAQDAHFYLPDTTLVIERPAPEQDIIIPYKILSCNEVWSNDKPHVVYGYVVVEGNCQLTIDAGTEVHFHSGSGMLVTNEGSLKIDPTNSGDYNNQVVIQGDRLEPFYENIPGQWGGVFGGVYLMSGSKDNVINNCVIKNGTIALRVDSSTSSVVNLDIKNSKIMNNSRVGLYGGFANINAENLVVANNGLYSLYALGGNYEFRHCTFANYWNSSIRNTPSIALLNFFEVGGTNYIRDLEKAYFGNCIVYGNSLTEFGVGEDNSGVFDYKFMNAIFRIDENPRDNSYDVNDINYFENCIYNQDPEFVDPYNYQFELDTLSPAQDKGNTADGAIVPIDIKGTFRNGIPDLGAYERID